MRQRLFRRLNHTLSEFKPRQDFHCPPAVLAQFQGHHRKALHDLRNMSFQIDGVLELRDSRAPLSCLNPLFHQILQNKPKIVLYTKADLSFLSRSTLEALDHGVPFMKIETSNPGHCKQVLNFIKKRFGTQKPPPPLGLRLLILGMPNSGKSTFINSIRRVGLSNKRLPNVSRTGNLPGITRAMGETVRVASSPDIFIYDAPGVMVPQAESVETILNLCLIHAVNLTNVVDPIVLSDYLLYKINLAYPHGGVYPGEPTNDVNVLLHNIWKNHYQARNKKPAYDETAMALMWLTRFANGKVCKLLLDDCSREAYKSRLSQLGEMKPIELGPLRVNRGLKRRMML